jgi:hypothetical protein
LVLGVCSVVPIEIAAIGFEIAGVINSSDAHFFDGARRRVGYVAKGGESKYRYWPTTVWS